MTTYYRFRPYDYLLDGYKELEKQTIYFAAPDELNDPMEGLSEFYWQGDAIVWSRLFEHYLRCVMTAVGIYALVDETQLITWDMLPWRNPTVRPPVAMTKTIDRTVATFMETPNMLRLVPHFAGRSRGVSEEELHTHLRWIHHTAVSAMQKAMMGEGMDIAGALPPVTAPSIDQMISALDTMSDASHDETIKQFFRGTSYVFDQKQWLTLIDKTIDVGPNRRFVLLDFSQRYLADIRKLSRPEWHAACFMDSYTNMSVWGHYGKGHTGVCLMFKALQNHGEDGLSLNAPVAQDSSGPVWTKFFFPFQKVDYKAKASRVNFFTSLALIPAPVLRDYWYADKNGNRSPLAEEVFDRAAEWREAYWKIVHDAVTRKFEDWAYEREHRLTFWSSINDLTPKPMRTLTYDFNDLEGIIFGIKTPEAEKLRIIRFIRDKCVTTGRANFSFFQAVRAENPDRIDIEPLSLLTIETLAKSVR